MKILIVHNRYLQPGGEDLAVESEAALLVERGHQVVRYDSSNAAMAQLHPVRQAAASVWNSAARRSVSQLIELEKPDVVHFHNTFPWLSPAVYDFRATHRPRVVQTLHNFRVVCPAATLLRAGKPCEACVGKLPWRGVIHACYRQSHAASLVSAAVTQVRRSTEFGAARVDAYIALTSFSRSVFERGGVPSSKLHIKPNFVAPDPGVGMVRGAHFLFAGRFEEGKGIRVLMDAWRAMRKPPQLRVLGSGPLVNEVERFAAEVPGVTLVGQVDRNAVLTELRRAYAVVAPALWYENFPLLICEAMATGCPVIASDGPNVREILLNGEAGTLFASGSSEALRGAVERSRDEQAGLTARATKARAEFETKYTADANYQALMAVYQTA